MKQLSPDLPGLHLTPAQAADVIRFYDEAENEQPFRNNWKRKISLARVALHTTMISHSILPSGEPLLSPVEVSTGLVHIEEPHELSPWPVEPTDAQWEYIFELSDKRSCPVDEAYASVMGVKPLHWN